MRLGRAVSRGALLNSSHTALRRGNGPVMCSASGLAKASTPRYFSVAKPPTALGGRMLLPKEGPFGTVLAQPGERHAAGAAASASASASASAVPVQESFRDAMMKERRPLKILGVDSTTTAGAMCGHASLGVLASCYIETDALTLRELVITGCSLNLFFSYYRIQPLWISIKWNALFLAINAALLGLMWKEQQDAEELGEDPEQARIFREIFMPVELSPVEFMQLMDLAQRRVVLTGNDINQHGRPHEEMFLIVEGTADVKSEGEAVCRLESGGFVGSMAFNRFIQEPPILSRSARRPQGARDKHQPAGGNSAESCVAEDDAHDKGVRGMVEAAKEAVLDVLRGPSVVGNVAMSLVPDVVDEQKDLSKMERSKNTVTATSDVVVYTWDMHALRAFIKRRPLIGASLQKVISEDFVNKVDQSRGHKKRYRLLLEEALEGGEINVTEKKKLQRYRNLHRVSMEEHNTLLKGRGWTEEEFEAGFRQGVAPRQGSEHFIQYEALVRRELAKGEVKPESKLYLLNFRKQAGIDSQEHLIAVEKQGWTADDYEVGVKDMSADLSEMPNSPDDGLQGDNRTTIDTTNIPMQRDVASESESQLQEEPESGKKKVTKEDKEKEGGQEGSQERGDSISDSIAAARNMPIVPSRPAQTQTRVLRRLEIEENCGAA